MSLQENDEEVWPKEDIQVVHASFGEKPASARKRPFLIDDNEEQVRTLLYDIELIVNCLFYNYLQENELSPSDIQTSKKICKIEGLHDADKVSKFLHSFSLDINIFKFAVFAGK